MLNPDPNDKVSEDIFKEIAEEFRQDKRPFVVFKHTNIDDSYIRIVSVCVDEE